MIELEVLSLSNTDILLTFILAILTGLDYAVHPLCPCCLNDSLINWIKLGLDMFAFHPASSFLIKCQTFIFRGMFSLKSLVKAKLMKKIYIKKKKVVICTSIVW